MNDDMTEKYQKHYSQLLTGTLTDTLMKSLSFQANIKLANEIISEQENKITDLQGQLEDFKKDSDAKLQNAKQELESFKNNRQNSENVRINSLESTIKAHLETINRLNADIVNANKLKSDYDTLKSQINNVDVFRKELIKERENHELTKQNYVSIVDKYENTIKDLNEQIELLKAPPKRKKIIKKTDTLESTNEIIQINDFIGNTEEDTSKDGGTF